MSVNAQLRAGVRCADDGSITVVFTLLDPNQGAEHLVFQVAMDALSAKLLGARLIEAGEDSDPGPIN